MHQILFRLELHIKTRSGAYSAPQISYLDFRSPTSNAMEGMKKVGGERTKGEGKRRDRKTKKEKKKWKKMKKKKKKKNRGRKGGPQINIYGYATANGQPRLTASTFTEKNVTAEDIACWFLSEDYRPLYYHVIE